MLFGAEAIRPGLEVSLQVSLDDAANVLASNIGEEGVTIDLSSLNHVEVDQAHNVAQVGPGTRWADVYLTLDALGLATSGGRVSSVGVGGLTLGGTLWTRTGLSSCNLLTPPGGKSFFAGQRGFVCDNVVSFEVSNLR